MLQVIPPHPLLSFPLPSHLPPLSCSVFSLSSPLSLPPSLPPLSFSLPPSPWAQVICIDTSLRDQHMKWVVSVSIWLHTSPATSLQNQPFAVLLLLPHCHSKRSLQFVINTHETTQCFTVIGKELHISFSMPSKEFHTQQHTADPAGGMHVQGPHLCSTLHKKHFDDVTKSQQISSKVESSE